MNNYLMLLEASTSASGKGSFQMIILMVLLFVGMYFLMIRPQKKQQKKEQEIRENTQVGDEITTIGGIVGKVVTVKEDSLIIETGADKKNGIHLFGRCGEAGLFQKHPVRCIHGKILGRVHLGVSENASDRAGRCKPALRSGRYCGCCQ